MRRSRRLKVSANGAADSIQRPLEIDLILREKGKIFLAVVFSVLATYIVLVRGRGLEAFWLDLSAFDWARGLATFFVLLTLNLVALSYLVIVFPDVVRTTRRILLVGVLCLLVLLLARVFSMFNTGTGLNLLFFIPLGFATLIFAIVYHRRFAVIAAGYLALLVGLALHFFRGAPLGDAPFLTDLGPVPILLIHLLSAVVGILSVAQIRKRQKLLKVGAVMGVTHAFLVCLLLAIAQGESIADQLEVLAYHGLGAFLYGVVAGFLLTGALPFIEYLFEVSTDISLLELTDQNHPILRRLLLEAPGTYHHSFIVGTLAEAAANTIGVNALLSRVGGYYHDIGKLVNPEYFTENESRKGSHHARLSPTMSTLIILAHIKDGMEIARDYNLPAAIMNFIPQHHGTSVVEYFFHEAQQRSPGQAVSRDFFRYQGPKPQNKETAIVFLADSVEAASRSLSDPTPARIKGLVHKIINYKLMDNQLDESLLSFYELKLVEEAFVRVLSGIFHGRIAYPETTSRN